jgi:hypothetical protein
VVIDEVTVGEVSRKEDEATFLLPLGQHQVYVQSKSSCSNSLDLNVIPGDVYDLGCWIEGKSTGAGMGLAGGSVVPYTFVLKQMTQ